VAKQIKRKERGRKEKREATLPLDRDNWRILAAGLAVIALGYLALLEGSVEGFLPLVVAPILLVLGYCVLIPLGILYRKSYISGGEQSTSEPSTAS
jgi:hypothetical protein